MPDVTINFENQQAAEHFVYWLCEQGEQGYWDWMEYREFEEEGAITATSFKYGFPAWNEAGKGTGDILRIETKCGRTNRDGGGR